MIMNNESHPNDEEELNEMPNQYVIDWDKVTSIQDIKLILQAVQVRFTENHPMIKNRMLENIVKVSHKKFEYPTSAPTSLFDSISKEQIDNVNRDMEQARMQRLSKSKVVQKKKEWSELFFDYYRSHARCPDCKSLNRRHSTKHGLIVILNNAYKNPDFKDERMMECLNCNKFYPGYNGLPLDKITEDDRKYLDSKKFNLYQETILTETTIKEFTNNLINNQSPMDQKTAELIEKNFWDLI